MELAPTVMNIVSSHVVPAFSVSQGVGFYSSVVFKKKK
jgi:hypothetical protein